MWNGFDAHAPGKELIPNKQSKGNIYDYKANDINIADTVSTHCIIKLQK
jgi:hypothetical protein